MSSDVAPAPRRWSDLGQRFAVGVVALPVVALLIAGSVATSAALFAVGAAVGAWEYYQLTLGRGERAAWIGVVAAAALPLVPWVAGARTGLVLPALLAVVSMLLWSTFLVVGPRADAPVRIGHILAGIFFAATGLVALTALRARADGLGWTAAVMIATWSNDTGAYLGGKTFGRHKLAPRVSPGKTWEGLASGLVGGALGLALARGLGATHVSLVDGAVVAGVCGVFGPLGDLCKSMLKRAYHAKDSGHLFPGHGGMLDRIDALLFNAPAVLAYAALLDVAR